MTLHPLDSSMVTSNLFFPRKGVMLETPQKYSDMTLFDGTISVDEDVVVGYRLFVCKPEAPLIIFFHGNGEIASDYDPIASLYMKIGVSLLVVDYRGYGWSTGTPQTTTLLPDAIKVLNAMKTIMANGNIQTDVPIFIMGRSLGSAPAIHIAAHMPAHFKGLIIDSGFADTPSLFKRLGISLNEDDLNDPDLPLNNIGKIKQIDLPLMVIHGEDDRLLPVENGQRLYDASPTKQKILTRVHGAGHNNLLYVAGDQYFNMLRLFVRTHATS